MFTETKRKCFSNGVVYGLKTEDGYPIEVTDTFLPYYTKNAVGRKQNLLDNSSLGDRTERWMIGVSTMSGCPVRCKFCATGKLKKYRNLTSEEIVKQVIFAVNNIPEEGGSKKMLVSLIMGGDSAPKEFKINYTRMGEPFLNIDAIRKAIVVIDSIFPAAKVHHYVSTVGIKGSDFSWIKDNITLQFSVHSFDEEHRNWLIPYKNKMSLSEMGEIRTQSSQKTTINLTLTKESDFDIKELVKYFDKEHFFIKLSPINVNETADRNGLSKSVITAKNLL